TRAVSTVTELLDRLATDGPSEQELESITAMLAQQQELSAFKRGELTYLADAALFHEPLIPPSELRQTAADMGPAGLASMARSVKETLLVHVPPDAKVEANWLSRLDEWNAPGPETGHKVASLPGLPSSRLRSWPSRWSLVLPTPRS
ncbi:MAG: hypothetical protein U9O18_11145, partial [Chloroflexota bacterium]|nr:hypothetical protein [Chloroflexota bacterium]